MEYAVTATSLTKRYRKFKALDDFSIHIPKGSIYGLVGKNGAGKTTLIRILCGLQNSTAGSYTLLGEQSHGRGIDRARRKTGAVVETPSIYLDMSARDNLKEQFRIMGLPLDGRIDDLLKLVSLSDTGKKKVKDFSLGMRQRLGIAIAMAGDPEFVILDEPVNGLDPQGIVDIRNLILKLNKENGVTFLISSHILGELSKLATNYGFIDHGQMMKEISAADIGESSRKCIRVTVSDMAGLKKVLDAGEYNYKPVSETECDIYNDLSITDLVVSLADNGVSVLTVYNRNESLERYYIDLVGGDHHE